ncbi:HNH endonuclease signature motif containing protein [Arthrobacter oryzae]|uniref:HNH endonuclease signature motif containing protein n=1 Tax=Arthrobacter oryzae TaxID=409290 RepID=UPI0027828A47|nr:HNH endonuclease signature motif containing protein [Arthrobacter oryzae]MDQ0076433.1 hypothetical protein [Arthrobacter oryzae]
MESRAVVGALEAVEASVAVLAGGLRGVFDGPVPEGADPLRDRVDACLDGLAEATRIEAEMAALKVHLTAEYADAATAMAAPAVSPQERTAQEMAITAEVACVLTVSERTANALLSEAHTLTRTLPLTLSALQAGTISWQHARVMVDETANLDRAGAAALEAYFLDPDAPAPARGCPAGELVPARFRAKARTWRERHHPVSIETRHALGVADRRVEYIPDRDGMAWLSAYLPSATAAGIWDRTTSAARALPGPDEARTLTQLRADVAATWLLTAGRERTPAGTANGVASGNGVDRGLDGNGVDRDGLVPLNEIPSPAAQVLITVPVFSLLGLTEEPAMLDGYGPVPPSVGRALVADGASSFLRVLIDPRDGAPLEIGRTSYRIPKTLRQWLRLRDGKCTFPGCNNQSLDNDADHLLAWARGGTTGISNLGQPCPKHHRLRHATAWTPTGANAHEPPGWTSPTGRRYPSEQPDWEPPRWPAALLAMAKSLDPGASARPDYDRDLALSEFPGRDRDLDLGMLDNLLPDDPLPDWDLPPQPLDDALAGDPFSDLWLLLTSGACKDSQDCAAPAQAAA